MGASKVENSKPAARTSFSCAVSRCSAGLQCKCVLRAAECTQIPRELDAQPMNSTDDVTACTWQVESLQAARTRTLDPSLALLLPRRADLLFTSLPRGHMPTMLPVWQQLHSPTIAQDCAVVSRTPSDTLNCFVSDLFARTLPSSPSSTEPAAHKSRSALRVPQSPRGRARRSTARSSPARCSQFHFVVRRRCSPRAAPSDYLLRLPLKLNILLVFLCVLHFVVAVRVLRVRSPAVACCCLFSYLYLVARGSNTFRVFMCAFFGPTGAPCVCSLVPVPVASLLVAGLY